MPLTFGGPFSAEMVKDRVRFFWTAVLHFAAGNIYISQHPVTIGGQPHDAILDQIGDISQLVDRKDPTRLDLSMVTMNFDNTKALSSGKRLSQSFDHTLEKTRVDLFLNFILDDLTTVQEAMFIGVPQSPAPDFGLITGSLSLMSYIQQYLDASAHRKLVSELDPTNPTNDRIFVCPFIRSSDATCIPMIFGNVHRAPGRVVKQRYWGTIKAGTANTTSGILTKVQIGPGLGVVVDTFTVTFTSATVFSVSGAAKGPLGTGNINSEYFGPNGTTERNCAIHILPGDWSGVQATGNTFTIPVDQSFAIVVFSESPDATPITSLTQLYWDDWAITSDYSVNAITPNGSQIRLGGKTDTSGKSTNLDAPEIAFDSAQFNTDHSTGLLAGQYSYLYTYEFLAGTLGESGPSGTGEIDLKDPTVPLPVPANQPSLELIAGGDGANSGVTKGQHRWACSYVSDYGETTIGAQTQQFLVDEGFVQAPNSEPGLTYEGSGELFKHHGESARSWGFAWVDKFGNESTLGPTRSVQMLDVPDELLGIKIGVHIPAPFPPGIVRANVYRTDFYGDPTTDFGQLQETARHYLIMSWLFTPPDFGASEVVVIDDGAHVLPTGPPSENATGGYGFVNLTDIPKGPPGTKRRRLYRTIDNDNGAFKFIAEIPNNTDTAYQDTSPDPYVQTSNPSLQPPDYRTGFPRLPLDADLSADKTNMVCTASVSIPIVKFDPPVEQGIDPTVRVRVYRSKKDKTGTHFLHHFYDISWNAWKSDIHTFIDTTPDSALGILAPNERPTTSSSGTADTLSSYSMRIPIQRPLLLRSLGLMISKVGNPTENVQIQIVADVSGQPTGNTIASTTLEAAEITANPIVVRERITPTIIPPGIVFFRVDTPNADVSNYYVLWLAADTPAGVYMMAQSSQQNKWVRVSGGLVFEMNGAEFTLIESTNDVLGMGGTGSKVAVATMDIEIPDNTVISVDAVGIQDDGSGTYTGTPGALITDPDCVVHWIAAVPMVLSPTFIDLAGTFAATNAKYAGAYKINGVSQDASATFKTLFMELGRNSRSIPGWSGSKFQWKWLPTFRDAIVPTVIIADQDVTGDSGGIPLIRPVRLGRSEVINTVRLKWDRRAWKADSDIDAYARTTPGSSSFSTDDYGALERPEFEMMNFVTSETQAQALAQFIIDRNADPDAERVKLTTVLPFLATDQDDLVGIGAPPVPYNLANPADPYGGAMQIDDLVPQGTFQVEGKTLKTDLSIEWTLREL